MKPKEFVVIGKIGSTYGIHGWLKVLPYTEFGADVFNFSPWYLSHGSDWQEVTREAEELQGNRLLVKLANVANPEEARTLTGKLIAVSREQLPKLAKDEYYWSDLVGLDVINKQGEFLGKVIYLMETGSNDVLVIKKDKEYGIPFLMPEVVLDVDLEKQQILVDWELI